MRALLFLAAFLSCKPAEQSKQENCEPILQEILAKQQIREVARKDFQLTIEWYVQGDMAEEVWIKERDAWLDKENQLLEEVNKLYEQSYKIKCLE